MCTPPPGGGGRVSCFPACGNAGPSVSQAESAPNCAGKGMLDRRKNLKWLFDDFFAGCEMARDHFAVTVGGLRHDDEDVASRIWPLGRGGGSGLGVCAYVYPPPPGCVW